MSATVHPKPNRARLILPVSLTAIMGVAWAVVQGMDGREDWWSQFMLACGVPYRQHGTVLMFAGLGLMLCGMALLAWTLFTVAKHAIRPYGERATTIYWLVICVGYFVVAFGYHLVKRMAIPGMLSEDSHTLDHAISATGRWLERVFPFIVLGLLAAIVVLLAVIAKRMKPPTKPG